MSRVKDNSDGGKAGAGVVGRMAGRFPGIENAKRTNANASTAYSLFGTVMRMRLPGFVSGDNEEEAPRYGDESDSGKRDVVEEDEERDREGVERVVGVEEVGVPGIAIKSRAKDICTADKCGTPSSRAWTVP